jgi:ABC-2 type transport system ATP-binding protein
LLKINNLKKSYKNNKVLDGLNMQINKGEVYGFIGRNGSGKTTAMNIICNIIDKDSGEVVINGGEQCRIGYLPEQPSMFNYMTPFEYLEYVKACGQKFENYSSGNVRDILDTVDLADVSNRRIKGFSRGMIQRLGIGAVMLNEPDLLILDEPTSALDPEGRADVVKIIENLAKLGKTILLCTHILSDAERVSDKIGILSRGRLIFEGTVDEIRKRGSANGVKIRLHEPELRKFNLLKGCSNATGSNFNASAMELMLTADNPEKSVELILEVMKKLTDNGIIPEKIEICRSDIEQVYLSMVSKGV